MSKKSQSNDPEACTGRVQSRKKTDIVSSFCQNSSKTLSSELTEKDLLKKLKEGISISPDDIKKLNGPTESNSYSKRN